MEEIRRLAFFTVARANAFALLAIGCMMAGLSFFFFPGAALRVGGILSLLLCLLLVLMGKGARNLDHRRTELWLYLEKAARPQEAIARRLVGAALREAYYTCARYSAAFSAALLAGALAISFTTA